MPSINHQRGETRTMVVRYNNWSTQRSYQWHRGWHMGLMGPQFAKRTARYNRRVSVKAIIREQVNEDWNQAIEAPFWDIGPVEYCYCGKQLSMMKGVNGWESVCTIWDGGRSFNQLTHVDVCHDCYTGHQEEMRQELDRYQQH